MRKLKEKEQKILLEDLNRRVKKLHCLLNFIKLFGSVQMGLAVFGVISGNVDKEDVPGVVIICILLYLVYFKLAGYLAKKNQWMCIREAVRNRKESVYEGRLLHVYATQSGDGTGPTTLMAVVAVNGKELRCEAAPQMWNASEGRDVLIICSKQDMETAGAFVYAIMPDAL